jgi:hypothetical protein
MYDDSINDRVEATSLQQLHIQANGTHKEVDAPKALARHVRRQSLRELDSVEDTILDREDEARLLIMGGGHAHGGEELPHVDIFASVDAAGENMRQRRFKLIE